MVTLRGIEEIRNYDYKFLKNAIMVKLLKYQTWKHDAKNTRLTWQGWSKKLWRQIQREDNYAQIVKMLKVFPEDILNLSSDVDLESVTGKYA